MKKDFVIRLAREGDLEFIQGMNQQLFVQDNKHFNDLNIEWPYQKEGETYFKSMIDGSAGVCFVAIVDEQTVGYLAGRIFSAGSAYKGKRAELDNMLVKEAHRGSGIGSALVEAFKGWCKENNIEKIFVSAFSPNEQAIAFYRKNGFHDYSLSLYQDIE